MQEPEIQAHVAELTITEADIVELVRGITKGQIIDLVKHNKYLKQELFRGFRPDHLPWQIVPERFARDARDDSQKISTLLDRWIECNQELIDKIASIPADKVRDELVPLLIEQGVEKRTQILWALRLDKRSGIREALTEGLAQELSDEASPLILLTQTVRTTINKAIEPIQRKLAKTVAERDEARATAVKLKRISEAKKAQAEKWQENYSTAVAEQERLHQQIAELQAQKQNNQESIAQLQQQLEYEQAEARELRQSISSLKATLRQQAEAAEGRDDTLLELEEERKTSSSLRLELKKLEQKLLEAYEKRDNALSDVEEMEAQLDQAQHDKEVIINQKRELQARLDVVQEEMEDIQIQREQQAIHEVLEVVLPEDLESAWITARQEIHHQLHTILTTLAIGEAEEADKLNQWRTWTAREVALVTKILEALTHYAETRQLPDRKPVETAQSLLTVRWYLLEYVRRAIVRLEDQQLFPF